MKKHKKKTKKLTCAQCKLPIPKGTLYTERKDGKTIHWRCSGIACIIDTGIPIGTGD